jgi:hypothetical protein
MTSPEERESYSRVDALFGNRPSGQSPNPVHIDRFVKRLQVVAVALTLLGFVSCTGVPGALTALWAWQIVEREGARRQAQQSQSHLEDHWAQLHSNARMVLWSCLVSLVLQTVLLAMGFYEALGIAIIERLAL